MHWLVTICIFRVLDVKPQEITKLRRRVDLSLPCILALAHHGRRHDLVSVLSGDEICRLQEDGGAFGKGQ